MSWDAIIIGGGHNGLVAAAYLARAGLRVAVLERRHLVGGACVTEEIHPGFHVSTAAYTCGLFRPEIKEDLELSKYGLEEHPFNPQVVHPFHDGRSLASWLDEDRNREEIAKFSKRDAKAYDRYVRFWAEFGELVEPTLLVPPVPLADLVSLFRGPEAEDLLRHVMLMSAADLLDEYFESDEVKASLVTGAVAGTLAGPRTPGTAYVLGHHTLGNINGIRGAWGWAKGGMGGITQALARAAQHHGAEVRTGVEVRRVLVAGGTARGVELADGQRLEAKVVVSNADPKRTFLKLVEPGHLPEEFLRGIRNIRAEAVSFKLNLALERLPRFKAGPPDLHRSIVDVCPSMDYLERAYDDAKYGRPSSHPFLEMVFQSAVDPTVAPPGKHTLTISCKFAPFDLREGSWPQEAPAFADRVLNTLAEYAPDVHACVLHRHTVTPLDLEQEYGLTRGDVFHAAITPEQMFSFRPLPGWSNYRTPIPGLYLCGAGTHPGGGVLGACGYNAAQTVLEDLRKPSGG